MAGAGTGRALGACGAALGTVVVAGALRATSLADPLEVALAVLVGVAGGCWCLRLALWSLLGTGGAAPPPAGAASRRSAEQALRTTEVAVLADGASMVLVRTAAIAAVAAIGTPARVMVVGADPRLELVARTLGARHVRSGLGAIATIDAALAAANGSYLALVPASTAVLPGALRGALERFGPGVAFVQCDPVAAPERLMADHVRHLRWGALDAHLAMPWLGSTSIVDVEAFRVVGVARGAAATTVALQSSGRHGRWHGTRIAVEQVDGGRAPRDEIDARAARVRLVRTRRSPLVARRLSWWQRIGHLDTLVDDLAGAAAAAGIVAVALTAVAGTPDGVGRVDGWWAVAMCAAVCLGWAARWSITSGAARPGGWLRASTDELVPSVRALLRSWLPVGRILPSTARGGAAPGGATAAVPGSGPARPWTAQLGLLGLVVVLDAAIAWRVAALLAGSGPGTGGAARDDRWLTWGVLVAGVVAIASLLASARVVRRRRSWRASRRLPASIVARIGGWEGRVLDLGAGGFRAEFGAPAELLAEVPVQLQAPGLRAIDVRVQVVRVEPSRDGWVLGVRLAGGGIAGAHDDYLALWLSQMAGSADERPRPTTDPTVGRLPARAGGVPALRLLTAAVVVAAGVAVLPPVGGSLAAPSAASATGTLPDAAAAGPPSTEPGAGEPGPDEPATDEPATGEPATGEPGAGEVGPEPGRSGAEGESREALDDLASATVDGLSLTVAVDVDRIVGGGEVVTHTARLHNAATVEVTSVDLLVAADTGTIDPISISGTCAGGNSAGSTTMEVPQPAGDDAAGEVSLELEAIEWSLFDPTTVLAAGEACTVMWQHRVPPGRDLADGSFVDTHVRVDGFVRGENDEMPGPGVIDRLVVQRPTLRVTATTGGGAAVGQMTLGQPATWIVTVRNVSPRPATAYAIDLVHALPPNWTYTATVSVSPPTCDAVPVVLVDDVAATQTVAWTDMCDLDQGDEVVLAFSATPGLAAAIDPGVVADDGGRALHVSTVSLTAEDAGGTTLGTASDQAAAVARSVDLAVRLTDVGPDDGPADPATSDPGMVVGVASRYRIDVANQGPDPTTAPITAALTLPDGIVAIGAAGTGWVCALDASPSCTHAGSIAPGDATTPIVVAVQVDAAALDPAQEAGVVTATAAVSTADYDQATPNDLDEETTPVRRASEDGATSAAAGDSSSGGAVPSLVALTADRQVAVGDEVVYEVVIANPGPSSRAGAVDASATMPAGLRLVSVAGTGWECSIERGGTGSWRCDRAGSDPVAGGEVLAPIEVRATVTAAAVGDAAPGAGEAFGHVVTAGPAPPGGRVRSPLTWVAAPRTDTTVRIVAVDETVPWRVEEPYDVEVIVGTDGPSGEYGPVTVVIAADDVDVVDAGGGGWTCVDHDDDPQPADPATGTRCEFARAGTPVGAVIVGAGDELPPIRVTLAPIAAGRVEVIATATAVTDIDAAEAVLARDVRGRTDVSIESDAPDAARVGEPVELRWTVRNDGPSATGAAMVVRAVLPSGWSVGATEVPGWRCAWPPSGPSEPTGGGVEGPVIECTRDEPLDARDEDAVTIVATPGTGVRTGITTVSARWMPAASGDGAEPGDGDEPDDLSADDDQVEARLWVRAATAATGDPTQGTAATSSTATPATAATADGSEADASGEQPAEVDRVGGATGTSDLPARLAGYGGAGGAFAFALVLAAGRRRRGW